jgi:hypothetical protein
VVGVVEGGAVVELVPAGVVVAGAGVLAGGYAAGVVGSSAWLVRHPATARLASSRTVARVRMGRMLLIPLGFGAGGPPTG